MIVVRHLARFTALLSVVALAACDDTDSPDAPPTGGSQPDAPTGTIHPDSATGTNQPDAGVTQTGFSCTTGSLFAGNPMYDEPTQRPEDGTLITANPPFPYRMLVFSGNTVITHDGEEIWYASLSDKKLHKLAGTESVGQALVTGPCAGARFANIFGIALGSDGSLYVSDQTANAILKITKPLDTEMCTVSHYAGTPMDVSEDDFDHDNPPNLGNVDAAGSAAKFELPERPGIDAAGNLYVWDNGNDSIREIASDADHTVTTIATSITKGAGSSVTPVALGGKVYVYGQNTEGDVFLTEIDPMTKNKHDVFRGRGDLFGGDSSASNQLGGIVTDGTGFIVEYNGAVFYVTLAGHITQIGGTYGTGLEFVSGYDPTVSHAAGEVELVTRDSFSEESGVSGYLSIDAAKNVYFTGEVLDNYVEMLTCH